MERLSVTVSGHGLYFCTPAVLASWSKTGRAVLLGKIRGAYEGTSRGAPRAFHRLCLRDLRIVVGDMYGANEAPPPRKPYTDPDHARRVAWTEARIARCDAAYKRSLPDTDDPYTENGYPVRAPFPRGYSIGPDTDDELRREGH